MRGKGISVILTGVTGMVGEGVLLECLKNPAVERVLMVSRKFSPIKHAKLTELIVPNFLELASLEQLKGYDACFFCAGVSSLGKSEEVFTRITYDTTLHFAQVLYQLNPQMTFCYVTGAHTDSSEQGKVMWARVKGRTENALARVGFPHVYNFRPGMMKPVSGQKNVPGLYRAILIAYPLINAIAPNTVCSIGQVAQAMINATTTLCAKTVLEVPDIKALAQG
jgi:uncharacterized protein YbjT (DUF2867 family)